MTVKILVNDIVYSFLASGRNKGDLEAFVHFLRAIHFADTLSITKRGPDKYAVQRRYRPTDTDVLASSIPELCAAIKTQSNVYDKHITLSVFGPKEFQVFNLSY